MTLPSLLEEFGISDVDVLQIDTEGFDAAILRMIPFQILKPSVINFEVLNLSKAEIAESYQLLMDHGYVLHENRMDCVAYDQTSCVFS